MKKIDPEVLENIDFKINHIDPNNLYQAINDLQDILYRLVDILRDTIIETPKEH